MNVFSGGQGLPERADPAGQDRTRHRSQHCLLFAVDVAGFTDSRRDDQVQLAVRQVLYTLVPGAFDDSLLDWAGCLHEDRGDGMLVIVPMRMPSARVVDPLLGLLAHRLREHNRLASRTHQIQLRAAVHIGEVHRDRYGLAGVAVNLLCRLLEAPVLKQALAESDGEVALIASDYFFDSVLRHRPGGIDPNTFWPVAVEVKKTRTRGWVHLPHAPGGSPALRPPLVGSAGEQAVVPMSEPAGPAVPQPADPAQAQDARGAGDGPRDVHGTVLGGPDGTTQVRNQGIAFLGNVTVHGDVVAGDKIVHGDARDDSR